MVQTFTSAQYACVGNAAAGNGGSARSTATRSGCETGSEKTSEAEKGIDAGGNAEA